jgi:hypothetical protein
MATPDSVVQVRRDGRVLETFHGDTAEKDAFRWVMNHQSMSVSWAIRFEGYSIVTVNADGTEEEHNAS